MIDFCGIDIIIERPVETRELRDALSRTLALPASRISVIDDIANYPEKEAADVVCVITPVDGEFTALLSLQSATRKVPVDTQVDVARQLASQLQLRCLTPKEGVDPYLMWLVPPGSRPTTVGVDPNAMDEGSYIVRTDYVDA